MPGRILFSITTFDGKRTYFMYQHLDGDDRLVKEEVLGPFESRKIAMEVGTREIHRIKGISVIQKIYD